MQTDESSDEVDGLVIHSHSTPERLFSACRLGDIDDVSAILRTWGTGFPGGRALPAQALLEAVAWARLDVVRLLLDHGAVATARGSVSTPGGSGVVDGDTRSVNAAELGRMMVSAGLRPRRALAIAKLVEASQRTTRADGADGANGGRARGRPSKQTDFFEAVPSRRPKRLRTVQEDSRKRRRKTTVRASRRRRSGEGVGSP